MGRKFLFLPILLLGTLISYSSAFATMQTEDGQTWYSAKEMMAITESDKKKVLSLCEEYDYDCWREVYDYMQSNRDVKYFIADLFAAKMFVPHVINHEKEEMKGIFRDGALLDYGYAGLAHYPMDAIYMAWFDIPTDGTFPTLSQLKNGEEVDGMHELFVQRSYENEIPLGVEYEMPVAGKLASNNNYVINFHVAGGAFTFTGTYDYSNCINSEKYQPGMECRFMMSDIMGSDYFPFWPEDESDTDLSFLEEDDGIDYEHILQPFDPFWDFLPDEPIIPEEPVVTEEPAIPDEPTVPEEPIITEEPIIQDGPIVSEEPIVTDEPEPATPNEPIISDEPPIIPEKSATTEAPVIVEEQIVTSNYTEDLPLAPNTGGGIMVEDAKCEKRIEFPWWIVALIAAGEVLIIWWFAPNYRKYSKK